LPTRVKPSARFVKSRAKIGEPVASRIDKTLVKFCHSPESPGLNLEALKNHPEFFTIRVNRNFRILLKKEADQEGPYWLLVDVADHDETYANF
jgi:hypothetical protein